MQNPIIMLTSIIADEMTPDMIADEMERAIQHFRTTGDFHKIKAVAMLIQHKSVIERHGSIEKMMQRFEEFESVKKACEHTQNKS